MLINIYYELFVVSIVTGALYLVLHSFKPKTLRLFSAKWHYYILLSLYLFLILPYHGLLSIIVVNFEPKGASGSSIPHTTLLSQMKEVLIQFDVLPYLLMAGTLIFATVTLFQNYRFHRYIFRVCQSVDDANILQSFENCKTDMGISKKILLYESPYATTPFIYGAFKPHIVLPQIEFTPEELRHVFYHELTHWKRRDPWLKYLMIFVHAIYWYNPIVYIIRRDIDRFCELSCDESVTRSMNKEERRCYGALLLKVLWNVADRRSKLYSALSSNKKRQLERRLDMILKNGDSRNNKRNHILAIVIPLVALLMGAVTVDAAIEQNHNTGYTSTQTMHKYVEGQQSASAPARSASDRNVEYTPPQTVHEYVEGQQSASAPAGF
jgi:bla regulator protein BlaR1